MFLRSFLAAKFPVAAQLWLSLLLLHYSPARSLGRSHLGGNFMAIFSRKGALFWSPPHLLHPSVMFSGVRESRFSSVMPYSKAVNISTPWVVVAMFFPQILAGVVGAISRPIWLNVRRARAQPRVRTLPLAKSSPAAHSTVFASSLVSN